MKVKLNKPIQIAGFRGALPRGAVVTVVNEGEAKQLITMGYLTETNDKPTHDEQSVAAHEAVLEKQRADSRETKDAAAQAAAEAAADPVVNPSAPHALSAEPEATKPAKKK